MKFFPLTFSELGGLVSVCAMALLFAGCATVPHSENFQATEQYSARILWERGDQERLVTDATFLLGESTSPTSAPSAPSARTPAATLVVGKGSPLLELHWQEGILQAGGTLARRGWRGPVEKAPAELADWGWLLQAWMAARAVPGEGNQEIHTAEFRVAWQRRGRNLRGFQMQPTGRPTHFTVQFLDIK